MQTIAKHFCNGDAFQRIVPLATILASILIWQARQLYAKVFITIAWCKSVIQNVHFDVTQLSCYNVSSDVLWKFDGGFRSQVVHSKQPIVGLTQTFFVFCACTVGN